MVSLEHISQMLSTSVSVFLACRSWEAWTMASRADCAPDSFSLLSRNHCSMWLKLYLKTHVVIVKIAALSKLSTLLFNCHCSKCVVQLSQLQVCRSTVNAQKVSFNHHCSKCVVQLSKLQKCHSTITNPSVSFNCQCSKSVIQPSLTQVCHSTVTNPSVSFNHH